MVQWALLTFAIFSPGIFGIICLLFTKRLQIFFADWATKKFPPSAAFVQSDAWIIYTRVVGAFGLAISIFLIGAGAWLVAATRSRAF